MAQTRQEHMAQIDAWQKANITRVVVKFSKKNERDQMILEHLRKHKENGGSIQRYIKEAIEEKMNK